MWKKKKKKNLSFPLIPLDLARKLKNRFFMKKKKKKKKRRVVIFRNNANGTPVYLYVASVDATQRRNHDVPSSASHSTTCFGCLSSSQ